MTLDDVAARIVALDLQIGQLRDNIHELWVEVVDEIERLEELKKD